MKKEMSRTQRRRQAKIRKMLLSLSMVLVLALAAVGGTIAWLTDKTDPVVNTFTVGDIEIDLFETDAQGTHVMAKELKMVPGATLAKDPTVTVEDGSENAYVFVKVEESDNLDTFISYTIDSGWTELTTGSGVYYRTYSAADGAETYAVLTGNVVTVNADVTKDMMEDLTEATEPTLTFTAYAVQSDNLTDQNADGKVDAADAWALAPQTQN